MSLTINDTIGRISNAPANGTDVSPATSSFSPAVGDWGYLCINGDGTAAPTLSVSDSVDGTTGWSQDKLQQPASLHGYSAIWKKKFTTTTSRTVTCRRTAGTTNKRISAKLYIVTGADSTNATGNTGGGESTTNNLSPTLYTSSAAGSIPIYCGTDWAENGTPTSTDTEDGADYPGAVSVMSAYGSAAGSSGSSIAGNLDAAGAAAADWSWAAVEVIPAAGGGSTVPPQLTLLGVG